MYDTQTFSNIFQENKARTIGVIPIRLKTWNSSGSFKKKSIEITPYSCKNNKARDRKSQKRNAVKKLISLMIASLCTNRIAFSISEILIFFLLIYFHLTSCIEQAVFSLCSNTLFAARSN